MITEDYVSFETAKLLKEKGFNWEWSPFYSEQDRDEWVRNNNYNIPNPNYDANIPFDLEVLNVIAPHVSLQMAMKYLREVHNFHIWIEPNHDEEGLYNAHVKDSWWSNNWGGVGYNSYEKACEAAIKYCLENLI